MEGGRPGGDDTGGAAADAAVDRRSVTIRVSDARIDLSAEIDRIVGARTDVGAVVTFTGICRDEGRRLAALEIEHYPGMAEAEISRIAETAATRWSLEGLTVIHRHGMIRPGEEIVVVVCVASHRRAAFEAADFLMDYLKTNAPFWKKEHPASASGSGDWVAAKAADEADAARWDP